MIALIIVKKVISYSLRPIGLRKNFIIIIPQKKLIIVLGQKYHQHLIMNTYNL